MATAFDLWWTGLGKKGKRKFYRNTEGVVNCLQDMFYGFAHVPLVFTLADETKVSAEVTPHYERTDSSVTYMFKMPEGIQEDEIDLQENEDGLHVLLQPEEPLSMAELFSISVPFLQAEITLPSRQGLDYTGAQAEYKDNLLRITVPFRSR